ncbi:MAG: DUF3179 domain-containing protein [Chloroflexi bacterium]|nr:DUF3179 domain-containing protein [Chloroflexota bacterium]
MKYTFLLVLLILAACVPATTRAPQPPTETEETSVPGPVATRSLLDPEPSPPGAEEEFTTDFSRHTVPYDEILSGGPPKDGIPAIDFPQYVPVQIADDWLAPTEPVILVQVGEEARAYPIQILMWHEIVNDTLGGLPILVSFCPLCNTAIAFERTFDGQVLDFGATGRLRYSNLIMYDRQTESWWQQATGDAIAGKFAGGQLSFYPAAMIAWEEFRENFPDGTALSRQTGFVRDYGRNPYTGYDEIDNPPFLYDGPATPGQLSPLARVLTVDLNGEAVAYPYDLLEQEIVINDTVGGESIVVIWTAGTASALDNPAIATGRDVGSAVAYSRRLSDRILTFSALDGVLTDLESGSHWDLLGQAIEGPFEGQSLTPVVAINHFWFSWAAFRPETRIFLAGDQ